MKPSAPSIADPWGAGAALAALVTAAAAAWYPLLGVSECAVLPLAATAILVAAGRLPRRLAIGAFVVWSPPAVLLVGLPATQLLPRAWPSVGTGLPRSVGQLATSRGEQIAHDPRPLAAALLLAGVSWTAAALLASGSARSPRRCAAFAVAALPWIAALLRDPTGTAGWDGAVVLLGGLLWWLSRHMAAGRAAALSGIVAFVSAATAQAVGPQERWLGHSGGGGADWSFSALTLDQSFGPLPDRRGRTMLEIRAAEPALWRMQALDFFDGYGWRVDRVPETELPQPAARTVWADVRVRGLENDLAVSPGRITALSWAGESRPVEGQAQELAPPPRPGDSYRVRAEVVPANAEPLRRAAAPTDPRLRRYTRIGRQPLLGVNVALFGKPRDPATAQALERTPYRRIGALARRLTVGAGTEWEAVARVIHYLRDGDRFRYTTHVPIARPLPLVDFLLRDHAGYCQHFAGAAALLLRLAGVPTRVVAGFATGVAHGRGRFDVRDLDAHDWIEVYFRGYGWVPFNPTPSAAPADVARTLDPLAPPPSRMAQAGAAPGRSVAALIAALGFIVAIAAVWRRRRRHAPAQAAELLAQLARRSGARVDPSCTLAELRDQLSVRLGPHTSALAAMAERARYAPAHRAAAQPSSARVLRALVRDIGLARAARLLIAPPARDSSRRRA